MNLVLLASDVLIMTYLTSWQYFYDANQLLFGLTTSLLAVSILIQLVLIYLLLQIAARVKGEKGPVSFLKVISQDAETVSC